MTRALVVFAVLSVPALAFASSGGDQPTTQLVLAAVSLAVNTYIANEIRPLKRRVSALEQREILQ